MIEDSKKAVKIELNSSGMPEKVKGVKDQQIKEEDEGDEDDSDEGTEAPEIQSRQKGETAEEKKARKQAAKLQKQLARDRKKAKALAAKPGPLGSALQADPRARPGVAIHRF
mmetsp:Transcript_40535/g.63290  ORF Transcript_40535/g.63290 Transcript_40535/m.63290 type:complete len:112 (-) Transcript_40535:291-626(-)|eukprot:CAMPEP_0184303936 /NCGR_PEP_ID=MMETSP1049-20130417/13593_1 /TAXON_ID=77928 /ORGANISM="Proteomonas sulcata, Strain CCMP704" /LENGTH=111 /DNA_ID=CAMNT_0026615641 /DNA_START=182 /DNA_END=517 /DNA_ORIENTATION=+